MKRNHVLNRVARILKIAFWACALTTAGNAGSVVYDAASGVRDLSQNGAWSGGVAPTVNDIAVLTGVDGEFTLGAPVEWKGLVFSNLVGTVKLTGEALTLHEAGISPGGPVAPKGALAIYAPIVLACDQEWYALDTWNGNIAVYGGVSGTGKLITRNYPNVASGYYAINSQIDAAWDAHGTLQVLWAPVTGDVDLGWGHVVQVYNASQGETAFRDIFQSGHVENDGELRLGDASGTRADVLFQTGDSIVGDESLTLSSAVDSDSPPIGCVNEQLGTFRMTGGTISNNLFFLRGGQYVQTGGDVWLRYRLADVGGNLATGQRFLVDGATASLDADRIVLGDNNTETMPNFLIVSNGNVRARTRMQLAKSRGGYGASTRVEVAPGGHLDVGGICFGDTSAEANTNAFAKVEVLGGDLTVGAEGVTFNPESWNGGDDLERWSGSWYRFLIADGTYRARASHANNVSVTLEGEATIQVDEGVVMSQQGALSGAASLTKTGRGTLALPQICAWTGNTVVASGTLLSSDLAPAKSPYLVFKADELNLAEGAAVDEWKAAASDGFHVNSFTRATASAVGIGASPTFTRQGFGGHAAVVFNGSNQGLAMTGGTTGTSNDGPINNATNFTVAVVCRATKGTGGSGSGKSAFSAGGILGQYYGVNDSNNQHWTLSLAGDGTVAGGTAKDTNACSVWSEAGSVIDDEPHVIFYNWTAGGAVRVNVDGAWTSHADTAELSAIGVTRMLLGTVEGARGNGYAFFGGEIGELRIYRNDVLTDEEIDAVGLELSLAYGANYVPNSAVAVREADFASQVPAATGVWRADDLVQAAGAEVSVWTDPVNGGEFNKTVGKAINGGSTAPTVSSETYNGHKAVHFDGRSQMLGMTGGKGGTYIGNEGSEFTVAIVLKGENCANGLRGSYVASVGVLGQGFVSGNDQNKWGIGVVGNSTAGAEQMCMGIKDGASDSLSVHGKVRYMLDGRPHVVICSFGTDLSINVDGVRATWPNATTKPRQVNARTTLGWLEPFNTASSSYFKGDIAEIRFFAGRRLSVAEQNALGRELARTYGVDAGRFYEAEETAFLSPRITVAENARIMGAGSGFRVANGTAVSGAGQVVGRFVLGAGGVIDGSAAAVPDFSKAMVAFEAGAVLKVKSDAEGKLVPLHLGTVDWPATGGVTVDVAAAGENLGGTVLTWSEGSAPDVSGWTVANGRKGLRFVVDGEGKCIRLNAAGMAVIIR